MRTLVIAAIAAAMAFGGTAADAQRIDKNGAPVAGWNQPIPQPQPMPAPPAPRPGAWYGQPRPNPQPLPPQAQPPRPANPGQWNNGGQNNGQWQSRYRNRSRWGGSVGGYWYAGVQAPGGWNGYRSIKRGKRIPSYWNSASFLIGDYNRYGLMAPPAGYLWTRYYNDALLIDRYGVVYDSRGGINWDNAGAGYAGGGYGYDDNTYYATDGAGYYGATTSDQSGSSSDRYDGSSSSPSLPSAPAYTGGTYYAAPPTMIVIPGATVTTTTTTYIEESYVAKRVYRAAPKKKWRPRPKPRCCPCGC